MAEWVEAAPAKVNLFLHVVGRRVDGFHLLDSLGPFGGALAAEADNLVLRAGRALAAAAGIEPRGRLTLEKHLPVASGIGGGSADAAAALRLLARLWRIAPPAEDLAAVATGLGADVPVCLAGRAARMGGVGEKLDAPPDLPAFAMVLVNPGVGVSTPAVFRARTGGFSPRASLPAGWPDAAAMAADLAGCTNDLEAPARGLCPQIDAVLAKLGAAKGCLLARMSGSGATCFGLFATAGAAEAASAALQRPGWWVRAG
jgi:4-diphosphocytidyl-2-C-methyl-D-erythritol kinase